MEFRNATATTLRAIGKDEKWLQDWLVENPQRLGIGNITIKNKELRHYTGKGGRLDILAFSAPLDTFYEIEVMLGECDPDHGFRVLDYWAREKLRNPNNRHVAMTRPMSNVSLPPSRVACRKEAWSWWEIARQTPIAISLSRALPSTDCQQCTGTPYFVTAGGLMSYGVDFVHEFGQLAFYVDRILRGGRPADLPVQAATKFVTALNVKTAIALGLTVPPGLLVAADEVIE